MDLLHGEQATGTHAPRMGEVARYALKSAAVAKWWMGASPAADSGSLGMHDAHRETTAVQGAHPMGFRPEPA